MRDPATRVPRSRLFQHLVDLLERKTFGLRHQEVGVDEASSAECAPEEEDLGSKIAFVRTDEVRRNDGDDLLRLISGCHREMTRSCMTYAVPQPIGGG